MKKGRYDVTVTDADGTNTLLLVEYSRPRRRIMLINQWIMQVLGHPCCEEGILGKIPAIATLANALNEAIDDWELAGNRIVTRLSLPNCPRFVTPRSHKSN